MSKSGETLLHILIEALDGLLTEIHQAGADCHGWKTRSLSADVEAELTVAGLTAQLAYVLFRLEDCERIERLSGHGTACPPSLFSRVRQALTHIHGGEEVDPWELCGIAESLGGPEAAWSLIGHGGGEKLKLAAEELRSARDAVASVASHATRRAEAATLELLAEELGELADLLLRDSAATPGVPLGWGWGDSELDLAADVVSNRLDFCGRFSKLSLPGEPLDPMAELVTGIRDALCPPERAVGPEHLALCQEEAVNLLEFKKAASQLAAEIDRSRPRVLSKWTQATLAEELKKDRTTIANWQKRATLGPRQPGDRFYLDELEALHRVVAGMGKEKSPEGKCLAALIDDCSTSHGPAR